MNILKKIAILLGARPDLVVVGLVVTTILMMVLPLPTLLVDILIAVNLSGSVLLLMMALTMRNPLDLSTLPSVILILTVFRLALSITTTRLILLQADAGEIIKTFGEFVIAGEIVVGLVIFLIITVVQFVVITKGAERVAEVSARFTLDALPGKQMSIDSDLRNGDITQAEARARRKQLENESQFYGAMDGAMKFVKGDAIAGLIIIAINLIGGICIGVFQKDMSTSEAMSTYSLLTVGDGLIAQLPALFVSLAAGSVITRVSTDDAVNIGSDITRQVFGSKISVRLAAFVMLGLALVPGLPWPVFVGIAALFFALSEMDAARRWFFGVETPTPLEDGAEPPIESACSVVAPPGLLGDVSDPAGFRADVAEVAATLSRRLGLEIAPPRLVEDPEQPAGRVAIALEDEPLASFDVDPARVGVDAAPEMIAASGVAVEPVDAPPPGFERLSLALAEDAPKLEAAALSPLGPRAIAARALGALLAERAASFIGMAEARAPLSAMAVKAPDLTAEVRDNVPLGRLTEVLKRLVDEGVPVGNTRRLCEALAEWGPKESDPVVLTEYVRTSLARQICHSVAGDKRLMPVYVLDPRIEELIGGAVRRTTVGEYMTLDEATSAQIVERVTETVRRPVEGGAQPSIIASIDTRRFVRTLLASHGLRLPVLSHHELSPDFNVVPVDTIRM